MPTRVALIVGARPNFMKAAPLMKKLREQPDIFDPLLIHTGQHYDHKLSTLFFEQLRMPKPDHYLGVGSGSQAEQTAKLLVELEICFTKLGPELVVVFGDVNSTLAASLVASKMGIKIAHVEAGLRSFDMSMPEEINRIVTDRLSDYLFVSEPSGLENLRREGVTEDRIFFTGNIMIDSLTANLDKSRNSDILDQLELKPKEYAVLTLHRPANVDDHTVLEKLFNAINSVSSLLPIAFPCHPRTRKELQQNGMLERFAGGRMKVIEPLGYLEFLRLQSEALMVLTDSGGIQEETTYLGVPCITLRENTERPITIVVGTNVLVGNDESKIKKAVREVIDGTFKRGEIPEHWDGQTAERIVDRMAAFIEDKPLRQPEPALA